MENNKSKKAIIMNQENETVLAIQEIIKNHDKKTLKVSLSMLESIAAPILCMEGESLDTLLDSAIMASNKKEGKKALESLLSAVLIGLGNDTERKKVQAESKLASLASDIKGEIGKAMASNLSIGALLTEACFTIKDIGGNQADFLAWSEENCNLKKAQAYKLMAVHKTFGDRSEFANVSMRVLYALCSASQEVIDDCKELASKGKLDTPALLAITKRHEPCNAKDESEVPLFGGIPAVNGSVPEVKEKAVTGTTAAGKGYSASRSESLSCETVPEGEMNPNIILIIEGLNGTISDLRAELVRLRSSGTDRAVVPMPELLQFDSKLSAVVLGIEPDMIRDKEAINKAYRSLAKIYTAGSNPEASRKLRDARDELLIDLMS